MRKTLLLLTLLFAPIAAAFPISGDVIISQGTTNFHVASLIILDVNTLTFSASDGAPIYDGLLVGYASAAASDWTLQHISDSTVVLNATTTAAGTMRFAGWREYEVNGVVGKNKFERSGDSSWPVGIGAQTVTVSKLPTMGERLNGAFTGIVGIVLSLFLVGIVLLVLARLATQRG